MLKKRKGLDFCLNSDKVKDKDEKLIIKVIIVDEFKIK
jgi:hypothetical protein